MLDTLCDHLAEKPGLYVEEIAIFLWDEFNILLSLSNRPLTNITIFFGPSLCEGPPPQLYRVFPSKHPPFNTQFFTTNMPESYQSIEARIQLAILELENVESPNIKAWAREHNLPYQRLLARYKGRSSRTERIPSGRKLDESQESALCRYIDFLDSIYLPPKRPAIEAAANAILASFAFL